MPEVPGLAPNSVRVSSSNTNPSGRSAPPAVPSSTLNEYVSGAVPPVAAASSTGVFNCPADHLRSAGSATDSGGATSTPKL